MKRYISIILLSCLSMLSPRLQANIVVIGNENIPTVNQRTITRIYTGRVSELDGMPIIPVNMQQGSAVRLSFLMTYLHQNEDKYSAYWTVRRYVGKGTPPMELTTGEEVLDFVSHTPGAIGYIDMNNTPTLNEVKILLNKQKRDEE